MESHQENDAKDKGELDNANTTNSKATSGCDEAVQLIEFVRGEENDGNTSIQLKADTVRTLVEKAGNRPLSVICICGPSRQGKSFILGYMIRCLEALEKDEEDWMDWQNKTKKLEGFKFRNGDKPETQGIWVWSRPFIVKTDDDREVAVLLIDTQGTYDEYTTNKDMSAIVGLSLLSSSVTIFNLLTNLQEDVLASMNTYTSYGQLALENVEDGTSPFQKLTFLIRDWNNPGEYPYGAKGGKKFLEEKLRVKPDQPPEAKQMRESIKKCFQNLDCFLMPFIGEKGLYPTFTGSISELAPNFAKQMETFISNLIGSETLVIKEVLGSEVTAGELVSYLENYIEIFNSNEIPSAKGMWDATSDVHNGHMVKKACHKFQELVKKKLRGNNYLQAEELDKAFAGGWKQALDVFKKARKFGTSEKIQEHKHELERMLEKEKQEYTKQNEEKRNKYLSGVVSDSTTTFRTNFNETVPFDDDDDDEAPVDFYEEVVIQRAISQAKEVAITEMTEKLENENEEILSTKIETLNSIIDETIVPNFRNKNMIRRGNAEKKMAVLIEKILGDFDIQLMQYHNENPFDQEDEIKEHHENAKAEALSSWKKAKKPGKKEFHKEFEDKLDKMITASSSRYITEHKCKFQECLRKGDQNLKLVTNNYNEDLTEFGESVEIDDELRVYHEQRSQNVLDEFAGDGNPYPKGHSLYEQLQATLKEDLDKIFETVKREVLMTQQKMEESYQIAVNVALLNYEQEMKEVLSSGDFMSDQDLEVEHQRNLKDSLIVYEDHDKIGFPDNALNFKVELEQKIEEKFLQMKTTNEQNRKLAHSQAKNCVTSCHKEYEVAMNAELNMMRSDEELELLHKDAFRKAKELFRKTCPAKEDQDFMNEYETKLNGEIEDTFEELKDVLEMKREQEEATLKSIRADLIKFYHDQMQKHCKNAHFIRPNQLDLFHEESSRVTLDKLDKQTPLSNFQKNMLEKDMDGMYEKYKNENDMKLNFVKGVAPAIGIDLGTTYCCVAVYYNGKVIIIPNQDQGNSETTASYVMYNDDGSKTIGNAAKDKAYENPENTIYDAKRIIGRKINDPELQRDMTYWPFEVVEENGIPKINVAGKPLFPEQVSAELLSEFRVMAAKHLGLEPDQITKAVITVPAYFNDGQRQATVDAGELAGLEVLRIVNEPTAAAIAYSLERLDNSARKVLVFDLGGGTFDVAVLELAPGKIEVLGVDGDTHLGGEDFDQKMMEYCTQQFLQKEGIDLMDGKDSTDLRTRHDSRRRLRRLQTYCEVAKKNLSSGRVTTVSIDAMYDGVDLKVEISKDKFEELNMAQFQKTIDIVERALSNKGIRKEDVDDIVLVGGSSRIPKVQEMLKAYFGGKALNYSIHPDKAVAYGAAVQAALMNGEQAKGTIDLDKIEDVTPMSLGIEVHDKTLSVIMPKNTKVPKKLVEQYYTVKDNQTSVMIKVFQGEERMAKDNELLGEFVLEGIPPGPKGKEVLDVSMEIDSMGILHVEAKCRSTRGAKEITISENRHRMSAETKSRLLAEKADPAA